MPSCTRQGKAVLSFQFPHSGPCFASVCVRVNGCYEAAPTLSFCLTMRKLCKSLCSFEGVPTQDTPRLVLGLLRSPTVLIPPGLLRAPEAWGMDLSAASRMCAVRSWAASPMCRCFMDMWCSLDVSVNALQLALASSLNLLWEGELPMYVSEVGH